jgi:hypothetical protein
VKPKRCAFNSKPSSYTQTSDGVRAAYMDCGFPAQFERVPSKQCQSTTACTAGQYESQAPTATSDRVCLPFTACTHYQFESAAASATSDRQWCVRLAAGRAGSRLWGTDRRPFFFLVPC